MWFVYPCIWTEFKLLILRPAVTDFTGWSEISDNDKSLFKYLY